MLELEVVVVVIGLRSETDLLDHYLGRLGLLLLLAFLLLIQELLVIKNLAYRRLGGGGYLDEIELKLLGHLQRLLYGVDACLNIVAYESDFTGADALIGCVGVFLFVGYKGATGPVIGTGRTRGKRFFLHSGDCKSLVLWVIG